MESKMKMKIKRNKIPNWSEIIRIFFEKFKMKKKKTGPYPVDVIHPSRSVKMLNKRMSLCEEKWNFVHKFTYHRI